MMADLTDLGVAAIRDGVAQGTFSALEVAEAFNANVAAAGALNAFIVTTPELAIAAAKSTDGNTLRKYHHPRSRSQIDRNRSFDRPI